MAIRKLSISMRLIHSTREKTESRQPRNARSSVLLVYASQHQDSGVPVCRTAWQRDVAATCTGRQGEMRKPLS